MIIKTTVTGLNEMKQSLDPKGLLESVRQEVADISDFLDERIDANAPIREGNLRANLDHSDPVIVGETISAEFGVLDASFVPIATKLHEEPFKLGPVSKLQPPTPEGNVGHKFIARVFNFHSELILRRVNQAITDFLTLKGRNNVRRNQKS